MASPQASGFGVDAGLSRTTSNTVQVATKELENGAIEEMKTYGGIETITEEDYSGATFTNEAVNLQTGTTSTGVVVRHDLIESNTEYARTSKETQKPLASS
jgi:hypothetical protein